jgi:hypothetical protein
MSRISFLASTDNRLQSNEGARRQSPVEGSGRTRRHLYSHGPISSPAKDPLKYRLQLFAFYLCPFPFSFFLLPFAFFLLPFAFFLLPFTLPPRHDVRYWLKLTRNLAC